MEALLELFLFFYCRPSTAAQDDNKKNKKATAESRRDGDGEEDAYAPEFYFNSFASFITANAWSRQICES